ncbi:two-component sensor histidine kinase [Pseudoclavibacter endophyticus]|nr:sensor histidine kinase [Pseudoclavibacter endophyticus]GGA69676.1 two-component sensor histidine kinase [Pseudoclavibacter endophyticus]
MTEHRESGLPGAQAAAVPARSTSLERVPWWDIMFTAVPAVSAVALWLYAMAEPPDDQWRCWLAAGLVGLLVGFWFAIARRRVGPTPAGYASLLVFSLIIAACIVLVPVLGILQAVLYPYLWTTLDNTARSIVATLSFALGVALAAVLFGGLDEALVTIFAQILSVMLSIGIGLALTYAWNVAEERQLLVDELTRTQERLRELSRQTGVSLERERLSRELHDTLAQTLAGLSLLSERAARGAHRRLDGDDPVLAQLDQLADLAKTALAETRALIAESAPVHDDSGTTLEEAIDRLVERFRRETGIGIEVELGRDDTGLPALPRDHEVVLLRCLQECLANVRRHARATRARVRLTTCSARRPGQGLGGATAAEVGSAGGGGLAVRLTVADDGRGFDPAESTAGFGLPSLRERARLLDGEVEIDSRPGEGSTVTITLPFPGSSASHGHEMNGTAA